MGAKEPKNPKSKNLFRNLSPAKRGKDSLEIRAGHPKTQSSFFSLFFSFFLFRLVRTSLRIREMVDDAMDTDKGGETALGAAAGTTGGSKRKIEVKKWNAVAVWSWSTSFDSCAICRNTLHEPSIEYQANSQQEGADGLSIAVRLRVTHILSFVLLSFASRGARFLRVCLILFQRDSKTRSALKTDHYFAYSALALFLVLSQ